MIKFKVYSASKLTPLLQDKISKRIKDKEKASCLIVFEVMPSLIGGIVIKRDDVVFDGSVSGELVKIKKHLSR